MPVLGQPFGARQVEAAIARQCKAAAHRRESGSIAIVGLQHAVRRRRTLRQFDEQVRQQRSFAMDLVRLVGSENGGAGGGPGLIRRQARLERRIQPPGQLGGEMGVEL